MSGPGRQPTISDDEILQVFIDATDPVLTTNEVAEAIDMSRRGAYSRLDELANDDKLKRKKVGQTGAVWWYPRALQERYTVE
jgi:predicted transcriptional regulator